MGWVDNGDGFRVGLGGGWYSINFEGSQSLMLQDMGVSFARIHSLPAHHSLRALFQRALMF